MCSYRPEVVDEDVENTQNHDQNNRTPLRLEPHHDHHARHQTHNNHEDPPHAPVASKHEPDEQEDQEDASCKLEVHLAIFLVDLGQTCWREPLPHPAVGEHHQQPAHDGEVAQEEVEVEDQAVAERLGDDDADEAHDGVFAVAAGDDEDGAGGHCDDVEDEEEVGYSCWDCGS